MHEMIPLAAKCYPFSHPHFTCTCIACPDPAHAEISFDFFLIDSYT